MSLDFSEEAMTRHGQMENLVNGFIAADKLSEEYQFPEFWQFSAMLGSLATSYTYMEDKDWQPELHFVPRRLSAPYNGDGMDDMLKGKKLAGEVEVVAIVRPWIVGYDGLTVVDTSRTAQEPALWDTIVINATEEPALRDVSPDGLHGANAKRAVQELKQLPSMRDTSSARAILVQASPTSAMHSTLQLVRMDSGEKPVSVDAATMGREVVVTPQGVDALLFRTHMGLGKLINIFREMHKPGNEIGIRPTVSAIDLLTV